MGQKPTRVVAQIQNDAIHVVHAAKLFNLLLKRAPKIGIGLLGEAGDPKNDGVPLHPTANGRQLDLVADDRNIERLRRFFADNGDDDFRPDRPAHQIHRCIQRQTKHAFAIDMSNEIARFDACIIGRRAVHGRDDLHEAFFLRHLDPKATKGAARLDLHLGGFCRGQISRMRVKRGQHPVDGRLDQVRFVDFLDILRTDPLENVAEKIQLLIDGRFSVRLLRQQGPCHLRRGNRPGQNASRCREYKLLHAQFSSPAVRRNQGSGSTGLLPTLSSI